MRKIRAWVFLALFGLAGAHAEKAELQAAYDSIELLNFHFPNAVANIKSKTRIDFCPDNTCDRFVGKDMRGGKLQDYAFLYVFFFSDYFVLSEFRKDPRAEKHVLLILAEYGKNACHRETKKDKAACLLVHAEKHGNLRLSMIRHDEKSQRVVSNSMLQRLNKEELQRAKKP